MAYRDLGQVKTFIAEGDLSAVANQYTFVKVGTAGNQGCCGCCRRECRTTCYRF